MPKTKPPVVTELVLPYVPPFDWPGMLAFFRGHEMTGIEAVGDSAYTRVFRLGRTTGHLTVTHTPETHALAVRIVADGPVPEDVVIRRIRRMFALDADPASVGASFGKHRVMGPLWTAYPGLRPAAGWDAFENGIATILGQLVSVKRAKELVRQLVAAYGEPVATPGTGEPAYLFPAPGILAAADLAPLGTTRMRKATVREFSRRVAAGELDLAALDVVATKAALLTIPGIGPWSSEYIAMRALAHHDSFPGADLILKRALDLHPRLDLAKLGPWRSYAAVLFWRHYAPSSFEAPEKDPGKSRPSARQSASKRPA